MMICRRSASAWLVQVVGELRLRDFEQLRGLRVSSTARPAMPARATGGCRRSLVLGFAVACIRGRRRRAFACRCRRMPVSPASSTALPSSPQVRRGGGGSGAGGVALTGSGRRRWRRRGRQPHRPAALPVLTTRSDRPAAACFRRDSPGTRRCRGDRRNGDDADADAPEPWRLRGVPQHRRCIARRQLCTALRQHHGRRAADTRRPANHRLRPPRASRPWPIVGERHAARCAA